MKKLVLSLLAILLIATPAMAQRAKVDPVLPGETFPGAVFDNFNTAAGGPEKIEIVDEDED